jgi:hypothetical protein
MWPAFVILALTPVCLIGAAMVLLFFAMGVDIGIHFIFDLLDFG